MCSSDLCKHTIQELSLYSWKVDKQTEAILPVLADENNHVIDALRYACEAVRRVRAEEKFSDYIPQTTRHYW